MYCPNCKREFDGKFCPECGTKLVEMPVKPDGINVRFGDANAINGGVHVVDSHNVLNEDRSVHNITNTTSTVNNITNVSAPKSEVEFLQERKALYLNACKRAYEDNVLEQSEVVALEECRIKLGLDKETADAILESARVLSERNARKTELNPIARAKLKILTENIQKNEVKALTGQIDSLEPLVNRFNHDELTRKYFLVLSALKSDKCIAHYEGTKTDNYWSTFWTYLSYIKAGRVSEAEEILASLDRFASYPEDNITVLATSGAIMMGDTVTAKELFSAITGEYSPALQHFVDSIYLLLDPKTAKEMGSDENACAFFLMNFFGQNDSTKDKENNRKRNDEESKSPQEMYEIGVSFYEGINGKIQDYVEAVKWFTKAVDLGNKDALIKLGLCYSDGEGVGQDKAKAVELFRKAADQGLAEGFYRLGNAYFNGKGVSKDTDEAIYWYRKAEECGYEGYKLGYYCVGARCCDLGDEYYNGTEGKPQDYAKAAYWYRKSAELGCHRRSLFNLAVCYANGQGVKKDSTEAVKWCRKAAEPGPTWREGDRKAQFYVGQYYEYGDGVPKDIEEALKWYKKAAEGGEESAKEKLKKYGK